MARALPRISFNSSTFIRLLSELAVADVQASRQPFAERLGLWLDWTAAIPLSAALHASAAAPAQSGAAVGLLATAAGTAAAEAIVRVRAEVSRTITTDAVLTVGTAGSQPRVPAADGPADKGVDFSPYRRCYQAHQRLMQLRIAPLRAQARDALAGLSPALRQLAALDGVLDQALAARERSLLASVPALLERRFEHLQQAHQAAQARHTALSSPGPAADPGLPPNAWLALACAEMQGLLLAEMEFRLQPALALVDALSNEVAPQT